MAYSQNHGAKCRYRRHTTKIKKIGGKYKSAFTAIQGVRLETTGTHTKHGAEMEQGNATKGTARYTTSFTPPRNPARHDKVQIILTDYTADETPEWYEELHRVANKIEERAEKRKDWNRIDETERNRNKSNKKCSKPYEAPHTQRNKEHQRNPSSANGKSNT